MERYPLHSILNILHNVNGMYDNLILPIFDGFVSQFGWFIFDAYIPIGLELHAWLHWKYDYT